jgi:hypothetical protein
MIKKSKAKPAPKSKSIVGRLKSIIRAKPETGRAKAKKTQAKPEAARKSAKTVKAKQTKPAVPPPNGKRKPTSITITRPEATRPPLVQMPQPKVEPPIGAPSILMPKGGLAVNSLTPVFRWMYVGGATRYEVEWSRDSHFGRGHSNSLVSEQTLMILDSSHALKPGSTYLWRVRGGNDSGWGPWSIAESFKAPDKA